jgi:anti-sigma B factor antagonist
MKTVSVDITDAGTHVLTLDGEFDLSNAAHVDHAIHEALEGTGVDVVVDLRGVRFLGSTTMSVLLRSLLKADSHGNTLVLVRPNARVWRVFVITGVSNHFRSFASLKEALAGIQPR